MTTDTPSVGEYRVNLLTVVQMFADGVLPTGMRGVATLIDVYAAAVRAEAIRERDEAIRLLRRAEWGGMDLSGGAGADKHCPSCLNSKETGHREGCAVAAFLSRFPEGGEG